MLELLLSIKYIFYAMLLQSTCTIQEFHQTGAIVIDGVATPIYEFSGCPEFAGYYEVNHGIFINENVQNKTWVIERESCHVKQDWAQKHGKPFDYLEWIENEKECKHYDTDN